MADILHDLPIGAEIERVFRAVSTPEGLDTWWTQRSVGCPEEGTEYELGFGPECVWRARVTRCVPNSEFDLELTHSDDDWLGTHVSIRLESRRSGTWVSFAHIGWPNREEHYRVSSCCWALYLRVLRRSLEHGESIPYEKRLSA